MKKASVFLVFLLLAGTSIANAQDRTIFFEGTSAQADQVQFLLTQFKMEAASLGYGVADTKAAAAYTFRFDVIPNMIEWDDGTQEQAPPEEGLYVLDIRFIRNEDDNELVNFSSPPFTDLDETLDFNQVQVIKAAVNIPPVVPVVTVAGPALPGVEEGAEPDPGYAFVVTPSGQWVVETSDWQNKRLYLNLSFSWPVTFYQLNENRLLNGGAYYLGKKDGELIDKNDKEVTDILNNSNLTSKEKGDALNDLDPETGMIAVPIDNKVVALPAVTVGLEMQFFQHLSLELKVQAAWESWKTDENGDPIYFINMAWGPQLKFPFTFVRNVTLTPYGAMVFPLSLSSEYFDSSGVFTAPLPFAIGGGLQFGMKGGKASSFFIDFNVMFYGKIGISNAYKDEEDNIIQLKPEEIHYDRFVIGIGAGYKFGFLNRRARPQAKTAEPDAADTAAAGE